MHRVADSLDALRKAQRAERVCHVGRCRADIGNHHRLCVAAQRLLCSMNIAQDLHNLPVAVPTDLGRKPYELPKRAGCSSRAL